MGRRMTGLTITCDHCPNTARYRRETNAAAGFDVRWACEDHAEGVTNE